MNQKEVRGQDNHWIAMFVAMAVVCFFSGFPFAAEEAVQNRPFDPNQTLLAGGVTPDFPGIDMADVQTVEKKDPALSVGAGVGIVPDYEGSEDYKGVPLLFARADWNSGRYVQFLANMLKANVIASDTWSFGPLARYRGNRDDDVDNEKVRRMREIDEAIEIGAFAGYTMGNWHVSLLAGQDVNDAHDGLVRRWKVDTRCPWTRG